MRHLNTAAISDLVGTGKAQAVEENSSNKSRVYRLPVADSVACSPAASMKMSSPTTLDLSPSCVFGTDICVSLPRMQGSHLKGGSERSKGIPEARRRRAISQTTA